MGKSAMTGKWIRWISLTTLLIGLLTGCSSPATSQVAINQTDDLANLRQQVAAQGTRIAALETRAALPQPTGAPVRPATGVVTATAKPIQPTPTVIPPVAGLVMEGATKGVASAKVTITEYVDYF